MSLATKALDAAHDLIQDDENETTEFERAVEARLRELFNHGPIKVVSARSVTGDLNAVATIEGYTFSVLPKDGSLSVWLVYTRNKTVELIPIDSLAAWVDSEGNMLVLCATHHRSKYEGIHEITYPAWLLQRYQGDDWTFIQQQLGTTGPLAKVPLLS